MTRKQIDKIEAREQVSAARRKYAHKPRRYPAFSRGIPAGTPLDRISFDQRLLYGFELLGAAEEDE